MAETKRKPRIGPLDTVGGAITEKGKVYRQARRGELDTAEASRLVHMLKKLRAGLAAKRR